MLVNILFSVSSALLWRGGRPSSAVLTACISAMRVERRGLVLIVVLILPLPLKFFALTCDWLFKTINTSCTRHKFPQFETSSNRSIAVNMPHSSTADLRGPTGSDSESEAQGWRLTWDRSTATARPHILNRAGRTPASRRTFATSSRKWKASQS